MNTHPECAASAATLGFGVEPLRGKPQFVGAEAPTLRAVYAVRWLDGVAAAKGAYIVLVERPKDGDQDDGYDAEDEVEQRADAEEVGEFIAAGAVDHHVGLVADGCHEAG